MRARLILFDLVAEQRMGEGWRDLAMAGMLATSAFSGINAASAAGPPSSQAAQPFDAFFKALHQVEGGGLLHPKDGDHGRAIGPFQIWRSYWRDAISFDPSIGGRYQDCRNYSYAKKVISAYLKRHAPTAWKNHDFAALARTHNGGPTGPKNPATREYAQRVQALLSQVTRNEGQLSSLFKEDS